MAGPPSPQRFSARVIVWLEGIGEWGTTLNLSTTGILLTASVRPALGSEVEISLVWRADTIRCRARVVRYAGEDSLAVEYIEPNQYFLNAVEQIIASSEPAPTQIPDYAKRWLQTHQR